MRETQEGLRNKITLFNAQNEGPLPTLRVSPSSSFTSFRMTTSAQNDKCAIGLLLPMKKNTAVIVN